MTDPVGTIEHLPWQYGDAAGYITTDTDTAATATLFSPGSEVIVHLIRTRRGRWRADATDTLILSSGEWRTSWPTPDAAIADLAARRGATLRPTTLL